MYNFVLHPQYFIVSLYVMRCGFTSLFIASDSQNPLLAKLYPWTNSRKGTRQGSLPGDDRFSSTPTRPRSSRFKKSWGSSSHGELTPQPGSRARKSKGFEDDDSSDNDSVDDESDTEIEDQEDEEDFIAHQLDTVDIANGNAIGGNPAHDNAKVLWLLKSGEEAKLEGMDMNRPLHVRVGFAPSTGTVQCRCEQGHPFFVVAHVT